ncbi:protein kinase activating protein dpb11 [Stygiomarasmius scandens]|uniref:Protein kinase activating protein dpb11 n=1 Tax=Marasmiellus scandens TaxID=2682957 RepID=A0ABR1IPT2_9AGAR
MRRRGHKSTKVPNVKLRPAQQGASSRATPTVEGVFAQDSQYASDDTSIFDACPRPFAGIVLCATGVPDKPGVFKQAVELGAATSNPFTDRVTHLIAREHGGAKYICALERKIPILNPSFVTESYQIWLRGDDVDMEEAIVKHRLPTFSGIIVCPSGITDIRRRTQINNLVTQHGGTYLKNLERPVRVTHLLCSGDEETDKMRYAQKFNKTGEADIKVVWEEWFWDSLEFGGRFDENTYAVHQPRPEPRISATQPPPPLPVGGVVASVTNVAAAVDKGKRAERGASEKEGSQERSLTKEKGKGKQVEKAKEKKAKPKATQVEHSETEDDDDFAETESASVKRIPTVQLKLWGSLLKNRGYDVDEENSRLVRSPTKSQSRPRLQSMDDSSMSLGRNSTGSILSDSDFRRANSFGPILPRSAQVPKRILTLKTKHGPLTNEEESQDKEENGMPVDVTDVDALAEAPPVVDPMEIDTPGAGPSSPRQEKSASKLKNAQDTSAESTPMRAKDHSISPIFAGLRFLLLGETNCQNVKDAVERCKGIFLDENTTTEEYPEEVDIVLIRLGASELFWKLQSAPLSWREKFRTECWLERCLFEERICPPQQNVSFTPVPVPCPIKDSEKVFMSFSGFDESERLFMRRLLKVLGITLLPVFSKRATYLLCPSAEGLKYDKAKEWDIPVVGMKWIEEIKRTGIVPKAGTFLVSGQTTVPEQEKDVKGKKKASEGMADITNGQSQSPDRNDSLPPTQDAGQHKATSPPASPQRLREQLSSVPSLSKLTLDPLPGPSGSFGRPNLLLQSNSGSKHPTQETPIVAESIPVETQAVEGDPAYDDFDNGFGQPPEIFSMPAESVPQETRPSTPSRPRLTIPMDDDLQSLMRVPSSLTPSPLKEATPAKGKAETLTRTKSLSMSPSKLYPPPRPIDEQKTKALHESLTSLLGKRRSDDGTERAEDGADDTGAPGGKRLKPLRSKSSTSLQVAAIQPLHNLESYPADFDIMETELSVSMMEDELREQSLRISYHDAVPKEKRRTLASVDKSIAHTGAGSSRAMDRSKGKAKADTSKRTSARKSGGSRQSGF